DPDLDTSGIYNLAPGIYAVLIEDSLGCEVQLDNLTITEPTALELTSIEAAGVSCFGKKDGVLGIAVSGGSPPYRLELDDEEYLFSGRLDLAEVPQGVYEIVVEDQNGCAIPLIFEITS
ncbi:SprB repeat-containing protein, partial [Campylobacter fetus subsp. venerealis]